MNKAVIFIVEGATDKRALENIFKKIYRYKESILSLLMVILPRMKILIRVMLKWKYINL